MRGEQLRRGGDVLCCDFLVLLEAREDLIFLLGDVELVEPADDLDVLAGVLGHHLAQFAEDGGLGQQILGHQQFSVVVDFLEEERHGTVPLIAGMDEQQAVGFGLRVIRGRAALQQGCDCVWCAIGKVAVHSLRQYFGPRSFFGWGDHAHLCVVICIHKPQRSEAVEPSVGHLFDNLSLTILGNGAFQRPDRLGVFPLRRR